MAQIAKKYGLWLILAAAFLNGAWFIQTSLAQNGGEWGAPLDDAWIHFQFARNIRNGDGFSYNPGDPTAGSTAPLWTILLAIFGFIFSDPLKTSLGLSLISFLLTIILTHELSQTMLGDRRLGLLAALCTAFAGRLVWASVSGMEVALFTACSLAALLIYRRVGLGMPAALLFGLASQLRPEGHLLFAAAFADTILFQKGKISAKLPALIGAGALYLLIQAPYAWLSYATTGKLLPNTFYAKSQSTVSYSLRTLRETIGWHWGDNWLALLLAPLGLTQLRRDGRLTVLWLVGLFAALPLIIPLTWHYGRYSIPLIPLQLIAGIAGIRWALDRFPRKKLWWRIAGILFIGIELLALNDWRLAYAANVREIRQIDVKIGEWLAANTQPGSLIAVDDIGAIGYLSGRQLLDLNGLISPEMWAALPAKDRGAATLKLMAEQGVDYLAIFPSWHADLGLHSDIFQPISTYDVDSHTIIFDTMAVVYKVDLPYLSTFEPNEPLSVIFDRQIALAGYDFQLNSEQNRLDLTLFWRALTASPRNLDLFVHILNESDEIVAQIDRQPNNGLTPTSRWAAGDVVRDVVQIEFPAELPPGGYRLQVGLFERETMSRLPAVGDHVQDNAVLLERWRR